MHTSKHYPGRYEACESELVARVLEDVVGNGFSDDSFGDCDAFGMAADMVIGKRYRFVLTVDSQGFLGYRYARLGTEEDAALLADWNADSESCNASDCEA